MSRSESGYSLVELMVAMVVTLIISGAVMQLIAAGNTAFHREPQLADRQQNIRVAMDVIAQDLYRAGYGLPQFAQVLTDGLDAAGPAMGSGGAQTDMLELAAASECPHLQVCDISGTQLTTFEEYGPCYNLPAMVMMANDQEWFPRWAEAPGGAATASCGAGGGGGGGGGGGDRNGHLAFPTGGSGGLNPPGSPADGFTSPPTYIIVGQIIRYRVNLDAEGVPNLERSDFGGNNYPDGTSSWRIIARGVEDLQVEYENGAGWQDEPGTISCGVNCASPTQAEIDTLVRRVRVRMSARVTGGGQLAGETASAVGRAVRGQLATEVMPRPVVATLGMYSGEM